MPSQALPSLRHWFHSLSSSPAQEPGDEAVTEAALFHAFSAIYYHESMGCPHTQTIKFTFENQTVNKAWSHHLNMCHM